MAKKKTTLDDIKKLSTKIINWGIEHDIDNIYSQFVKVVEEYTEILAADNTVFSVDADKKAIKKAQAERRDAIGDFYVATIILLDLMGVDVNEKFWNDYIVIDESYRLSLDDLCLDLGDMAHYISHNEHDINKLEDIANDMIINDLTFAEHCEEDFYECVKSAYNEIKNRKGKTIDGNFVKNQ